MTILLFIIILAVLILVHEFGHFIVAKKCGMRVDEFGIGFPPKLWGKKYGETEYTINAIPFGGFVRIYGENPDDSDESLVNSERSFANSRKIFQVFVLCAGVFFNFLLAWFLFSVGLIYGLPASEEEAIARGVQIENVSTVITSVSEDSPAYAGGLESSDKILSLSSEETLVDKPTVEDVQAFIGERVGKPIKINIERENNISSVSVVPKDGIISGKGAIGISLDAVGTMRLPIHKAIYAGAEFTINYTKMTCIGLYELLRDAIFGRADLNSVSGPIGIVKIIGNATEMGIPYLIILVALISINLAVVNILPIPALDGGRLLFVAIEVVMRKPMSKKMAANANIVGFSVLMLLILAITFHDIWKLFI